MDEMTATEVARSFSAVLDRTERGESVVVTRGGEPVAMLVPAPRTNGAAIRDVVRRYSVDPALTAADDDFVRAVEWARGLPADVDGAPWRD